MIGIYKITSPTNRVYIGQSRNIKSRFRQYKGNLKNTKGQILLYRSFKKYKVENHIFEVLEECETKDLNLRERYWQDFYDVLNGGLNCVLQETDVLPRELSEETKKKLSESFLGEKNPMYGKFGKLNPNYGNKWTKKQKKHLSDIKKGKHSGENNSFYGEHHSIKTKELLSDIAKKRVGELNPFYGREHTEKFKKEASKRVSEFFKNNPEAKENLRKALFKREYHTPYGVFMSTREAARSLNISRCTVYNRCMKKTDKKVGYNYQLKDKYKGEHTWREIGWFTVEACEHT